MKLLKKNPDLFTLNYKCKELQFYNSSLYNLYYWEYH